MTAEGTFPKSDGDVLYDGDVNKMLKGEYIYMINSDFDSTDIIYLHNTINSIFLMVNSPDVSSLELKLHSISSGTISDSFSSPVGAPSGLAYDGSNLISCDSSSDKIYIHSGVTSTITNSFSTPSVTPHGLTYDGSNLISCDGSSGKIYIHSGVNPEEMTFSLGYNNVSIDTSTATTDNKFYITKTAGTVNNLILMASE
jgi:hypothetical protein